MCSFYVLPQNLQFNYNNRSPRLSGDMFRGRNIWHSAQRENMILFFVNNVNVFCLPHIAEKCFFQFLKKPLSISRVNLIHLFFIQWDWISLLKSRLYANLTYLVLIEEFANLFFHHRFFVNFVSLTPKRKLSCKNKDTYFFFCLDM